MDDPLEQIAGQRARQQGGDERCHGGGMQHRIGAACPPTMLPFANPHWHCNIRSRFAAGVFRCAAECSGGLDAVIA